MFNDMIFDVPSNEILSPKVLVRGRKLNIFLVFITESYFAVP